jgi:hypothetical protein
MNFAVIAEHPCQPGLMIGFGLPELPSRDTATDVAFAMFNSYQFLGSYLPGEAGEADFLFVYWFKRMRLATVTASSLDEAGAMMDRLAEVGELISSCS